MQAHVHCVFLRTSIIPSPLTFTRPFVTLRPVEAHAFGLSLSASARMAKTTSYELSASTDDFRKVTGVLYV